jgi:hypothetical protein
MNLDNGSMIYLLMHLKKLTAAFNCSDLVLRLAPPKIVAGLAQDSLGYLIVKRTDLTLRLAPPKIAAGLAQGLFSCAQAPEKRRRPEKLGAP